MIEIHEVMAFVAFAALVSILTATSFVAMVVAQAAQRHPGVVDISPSSLDIVLKVSKFTFGVSSFAAILIYMFGGLGLLFLGIPSFLEALLP